MHSGSPIALRHTTMTRRTIAGARMGIRGTFRCELSHARSSLNRSPEPEVEIRTYVAVLLHNNWGLVASCQRDLAWYRLVNFATQLPANSAGMAMLEHQSQLVFPMLIKLDTG